MITEEDKINIGAEEEIADAAEAEKWAERARLMTEENKRLNADIKSEQKTRVHHNEGVVIATAPNIHTDMSALKRIKKTSFA